MRLEHTLRSQLTAVLVGGAIVLCAGTARAQGPEAAAAADGDATASQQPAAPATTPAGRVVIKSLSGNVGAQWVEGATSQDTFSASASAARLVQEGGKTALKSWGHYGAFQLYESTVTASGQSVSVADTETLRYTAEYSFTQRLFLMLAPAYLHNGVQAVDYHVEELAGLGVRVIDDRTSNRQGALNVVVGGGGLQQHKNVPSIDGGAAAATIYQTGGVVWLRPDGKPAFSVTQHFIYLQNLNKTDDNRLDLSADASVTIIGPVTVTLSYQAIREAVVATGNQQRDQHLSLGLGVSFKSP
jgi:hypothetical protein